MQLSTFIVARLDTIVEEWQASARTSAPAQDESAAAELRACLDGLLLTIAGDMERDGSAAHARTGARHADAGGNSAPATRHGRLRQQQGFGLGQLVDEFGSLRTTVLTRWYFSGARKDSESVLQQGLRFNQVVDAALRDSAESFVQALTATRDTHLFTLLQDLRSPLSAIHVASAVLARPDFGPETRRNSTRRARAALTQMDGLISDLLEYTRSRSAPGIPVDKSSCDLKHVCEASIETLRASHPARTFHLATSGDLVLGADAPRVQQALLNLLHNALQHGDGQSVIKLVASGDEAGVLLSVWNAGRAIPEASLEAIFEPWVRAPSGASDRPDRLPASLGLGLFIAREIALAHGGTIAATSDASAGTRFTIRLPRPQAAAATATGPRPANAGRPSRQAG